MCPNFTRISELSEDSFAKINITFKQKLILPAGLSLFVSALDFHRSHTPLRIWQKL